MATQIDFDKAAKDVLELSKRPSNKDLLKLYAFYKQAVDGEISGKRPGVINISGRAKYDAWKNLSGMKKTQARDEYVKFVKSLIKKHGG